MYSSYSNIIYIDRKKLSLNQYKYKKVEKDYKKILSCKM